MSFYKAFLQIAQDNERVWKPFLGYLLLHQASERMIVAFLPSNKHLSKLSPKDILQLAEKVPSTVNSLVTAIGGAWVLFKMESFKVERSTDSLFTPYPPLLDQVFAAHSAFTMYDMWVMSVKGQEHFSVWIHHVLSFLGTTFMRHFKHAAFFPAAFTLTEGTVVVSNLVWILQKLKLDSGSLFRCVSITSISNDANVNF